MKIVTYNMKFGGKGRVHWKEVMARFSPDVLLVQESYPPSEHLAGGDFKRESTVWAPASISNKTMKWGSGIYLPNWSLTPIQLPEFHGWVVGAEARNWPSSPTGSESTRFFSLHAPSGLGSYQKVVNRILDRLIEFRAESEIVIGGDFNLTVAERHEDEVKTTSASDLEIQHRLRDEFGLVNCWQTANPAKPLPQTLRWVSKPDIPFHCDGLFVPKGWASKLTLCTVVNGGLWKTLSDHNPILAEFR